MDKKTINKLINNFDKKQLHDLVVYLVSKSEKAGEELLDYCQKNGDAKADTHMLIIENKVKKHWEKASRIIEEFDLYGGGSESDEEDAYDELESMADLLESNQVPWGIRKGILDEMLAFVESDNSGFTDYLVDIAFTMCTNKQENIYLADFLAARANSYYKGIASRIYLENGEEQKFIESKSANLEYGSDYLELAEYYRKHNEEERALKIVLEGLDKTSGRLDEIYVYLFKYYKKKKDEAALEQLYADSKKRRWDQDTITELMYQYYKEKGDYAKQKNALINLISCSDDRKLYELYQRCRQELSDKDFAEEEKKILNTIKKRKVSTYFDILIDKEETKEVIEYITQHQQYVGWGIDQGHYFSKRLAGEYPREVVEMYWREVSSYVAMGKEKNYARAVSVLKEIRRIMKQNKWTDEWNRRYKEFLNVHRRKKLLLGQLKGFEQMTAEN